MPYEFCCAALPSEQAPSLYMALGPASTSLPSLLFSPWMKFKLKNSKKYKRKIYFMYVKPPVTSVEYYTVCADCGKVMRKVLLIVQQLHQLRVKLLLTKKMNLLHAVHITFRTAFCLTCFFANRVAVQSQRMSLRCAGVHCLYRPCQ